MCGDRKWKEKERDREREKDRETEKKRNCELSCVVLLAESTVDRAIQIYVTFDACLYKINPWSQMTFNLYLTTFCQVCESLNSFRVNLLANEICIKFLLVCCCDYQKIFLSS